MTEVDSENANNAEGTETFLTPDEVGEMLGIGTHDLKQMREDGTGPAYFTILTMIRYLPADVEAWRSENPNAGS